MKTFRTGLVVSLLVLVAFPVFGAEYRSGVGVAFNSGTLDRDGLFAEIDTDGYTVFYKWGLDDHWGILVSYRDMEDDEDFLIGDFDYTQIGAHAVYMWRHGMRVRPHVKFGLAFTDVDDPGFLLGPFSEDDTTISIGGGLEAGTEKVAFYADYDYTEPEISGVDFEIATLSVGVIFKF